MLTTAEYTKITKRLLHAHAPSMINDPDFHDAVIREVMIADWKYDPVDYTGNGGKTLEGYRKQRAQWIIFELFKKKKRAAKNTEEITEFPEDEELDIGFGDYVSAISDSERELLDLRFTFDMTFKEIGKLKKCTPQSIHLKMNEILRKLKREIENSPSLFR